MKIFFKQFFNSDRIKMMQNQNDFNTTAFQVFKSNEIEIMKKNEH